MGDPMSEITNGREEERAIIKAAVERAMRHLEDAPEKVPGVLRKAAEIYVHDKRAVEFYPPAKGQKTELRKLKGHLAKAIDTLESIDPSWRVALDGIGRDESGGLARPDTQQIQMDLRVLRANVCDLIAKRFENTRPVNEALEAAILHLLVILDGKYGCEILVAENKPADGIHELRSPAARATYDLLKAIDDSLTFTAVASMIVRIRRKGGPTPTVRNQLEELGQ